MKIMMRSIVLCGVMASPVLQPAMDMAVFLSALEGVGLRQQDLDAIRRAGPALRYINGDPMVVIDEDMKQLRGEAPLPDDEALKDVQSRLLRFLTEKGKSRAVWHNVHPEKHPGLMFQIILTRGELAKMGYGRRAALRSAIKASQVELFKASFRVELLTALVKLGYVHAYRATVLLAEEFCKRPEVPDGHVPCHFVKLLLEELLKREEELREWSPQKRQYDEDHAEDGEGESSEPAANQLFDGRNIIERARAALEHPRLQSLQ